MRTVLWLLVISAFLSFASLAAQDTTGRPVATVRQLHDAMITPSSDAIFDVGRAAPNNDTAWTEIRNRAVILAESGNLLMLGGRAKDSGEWAKLSRALVDAGAAALKAAETKNMDALLEVGDQLVPICEGCHKPYRDAGHTMGPR